MATPSSRSRWATWLSTSLDSASWRATSSRGRSPAAYAPRPLFRVFPPRAISRARRGDPAPHEPTDPRLRAARRRGLRPRVDFGIGLTSGVDAWRTIQRAQALGFSHAWLVDTQPLCADLFASMAVAAVHT